MKFPGWLSKVVKIGKKIFDIAVKGREAGLWSRKASPAEQDQIRSIMSNPDFDERDKELALSRFKAVASVYSDSANVLKVSNGISHSLAAFLSVFTPILLTQIAGIDFNVILGNPRAFGALLLGAVVNAVYLYNQRPGQASVMLGSSSDVREEAETKTSLKLVVPISPEGGK
jgi:hypothetical protein